MRLEDAFLYLVVESTFSADSDLVTACGEAIAGGADIIQVETCTEGDDAVAAELPELCRKEQALLVVKGDPAVARDLGADGVHLGSRETSMGLARAIAGEDCFVGMSTCSLDEALLGLEIGADYLLHHAGTACVGTFAALRGRAHVPLFAAGIACFEEAEEMVGKGIVRLCVELSRLDAARVKEEVAEYSQLLGRCI